MTLRHRLGGDARHLFEQVNTLLDNEDALIVLFDGRRMVSYTHGFAASPSQLELLDAEIERSIRSAVGGQSTGLRAAEQAMDEVLADSFPASDPPSWNPGIIRPHPADSFAPAVAAQDGHERLHLADVIDVSGPAHGERTSLQPPSARALRVADGPLKPHCCGVRVVQ